MDSLTLLAAACPGAPVPAAVGAALMLAAAAFLNRMGIAWGEGTARALAAFLALAGFAALAAAAAPARISPAAFSIFLLGFFAVFAAAALIRFHQLKPWAAALILTAAALAVLEAPRWMAPPLARAAGFAACLALTAALGFSLVLRAQAIAMSLAQGARNAGLARIESGARAALAGRTVIFSAALLAVPLGAAAAGPAACASAPGVMTLASAAALAAGLFLLGKALVDRKRPLVSDEEA